MNKVVHEGIKCIVPRQLSSGVYDRRSKRDYVLKQRVLKAIDDSLAGSTHGGGKKYADSLPRVFDHLEIDDRDKLFRAFLEPNNYGERVLRFIVSERLEPITSLTDLEEFKTAFRDIFHVIHYLAVSEDGIKHRDISISNLMYRRLEDGSVQGVLNDWDVASTSRMEFESDHMNMRTGTMPFMSIDLHQKLPPVHMERFEYESLFYVLYWICLSYSNGKLLPEEKRHSAFKRWPRWNSNDHEGVHSAKVGLLNDIMIFEDVNRFPAMYRPLVQPRLECLRYTLRRGFNAHDEANIADKLAEFDDITLGGHMSYENIRKILQN
ncbi:other 1 kinase [Pyrrhoderma noxium]|uniref:Other 1 kinase n=1 Tax=Pyrrhoderma noxium TaxID=2282107 RepID=A0A286UKD5_9AGAM|nr:other 1 kinase [Pyrrhoderma noxium]